MTRFGTWAAALMMAGLVAGCLESATEPQMLEPTLADGKSDVAQSVTLMGPLEYGADAALKGTFTQDLEFHGYEVGARTGAMITLEVTQLGSSKSLDTTLFVFGPRTDAAGYGTSALVKDGDSGWGRLSKVKNFSVPSQGTYLVVVGTGDGQGRGNYRLQLTCNSGECDLPQTPAPAGQCYPSFALAIDACVEGNMADDPEWFYSTTRRNLVEQCADIEIVAPAYDALCATPEAPASVCELSLEEISYSHIPVCFTEAWNRQMDGMCVFGTRYRELFDSGALVVLGQKVLTAQSALGQTEEAQLLQAVQNSAYSQVASVAEAFDAVDDNKVFQTEIWDGSNRKAFTAYEFGAGDNSYGLIFDQGLLTIAAKIQDGDLYECSTLWGPELRDCASDSECAQGLKCVGIAQEIHRGRCIDLQAPPHTAQETFCTFETGCPAGSGLQCAGAKKAGDEGICRPAWLTGHFSTLAQAPIADNSADGTEVALVAYGLATVDVDIRLNLVISHERISDLTVKLVNPAGTEVVLFAPPSGTKELWLQNYVVNGFSGDEQVNGIWRLRVTDNVGGKTGAVNEFGLIITSRWD